MIAARSRRLTTLVSLAGMVLGWLLLPVQLTANPPEPQCVCAECGTPCGSGHTADCSSRPKS